mmetsp:Transcript_6127/g.13218  ORF Transcript_6127/g.13218 Transcript_6127/m.13218 type:complete len:224 (-) Transcript_6127:61-732(-)
MGLHHIVHDHQLGAVVSLQCYFHVGSLLDEWSVMGPLWQCFSVDKYALDHLRKHVLDDSCHRQGLSSCVRHVVAFFDALYAVQWLYGHKKDCSLIHEVGPRHFAGGLRHGGIGAGCGRCLRKCTFDVSSALGSIRLRTPIQEGFRGHVLMFPAVPRHPNHRPEENEQSSAMSRARASRKSPAPLISLPSETPLCHAAEVVNWVTHTHTQLPEMAPFARRWRPI